VDLSAGVLILFDRVYSSGRLFELPFAVDQCFLGVKIATLRYIVHRQGMESPVQPPRPG